MGKAQEIAENALSTKWVVFEGTCDVLPLIPDDWELHPKTGKRMKTVKGLELRFINGYTRPYDMEYHADVEYVEAVRKYLKEEGPKDSRIAQFSVKETQKDAIRRPFNNFDNLNAKKIVELVTMLMPEDDAQQVPFVERCIGYEAQNKGRKTVIDGLGELIDDGVEDNDLVEVEVEI